MDNRKRKHRGKNNSNQKFYRDGKRGDSSRVQSSKDDRPVDTRFSQNRNVRSNVGSLNDLSWYNRYPDLLASAGAIPYPYRPGMQQPTSEQLVLTAPNQLANSVVVTGSATIPGVMALDWVPSVGISNSVTDPASIVCKEMYARVRAAFSGSLDVDAPDLLMYVMALDSIFAYIAHMKRIYRTVSVWTPQNYVLPDTMLTAYGCTAAFIQDVRKNKTAFWGQINELIYQSRKFTCPAVMDIFNRHYWMSDNVYGDSPDANAQFYCFRLAGVYRFEELPLANDPSTLASGLHMKSLPGFDTATDMFEFGRDLIDALVAWDEAYTVNGYLLKAYADTPSFVVQTLDQDELLTPVFVPEVLSQIENSSVAPFAWSTYSSGIGDLINPNFTSAADMKLDVFSGMNVVQDVTTNAVIANPTLATQLNNIPMSNMIEAGFFNTKPMFSIRSLNPTVADTVLASRLNCAVNSAATVGAEGITALKLSVIAGSEVPLAWTLYNSQSGIVIPQRLWKYSDKNIESDNTANLPAYMAIEQFDWHPFIRMDSIVCTSANFGSYITNWIGDVHNSTSVTVETLRQLHRVCVYSEFNAFNA